MSSRGSSELVPIHSQLRETCLQPDTTVWSLFIISSFITPEQGEDVSISHFVLLGVWPLTDRSVDVCGSGQGGLRVAC